jgi:transcriptional regulator with XRE-family HTH domain
MMTASQLAKVRAGLALSQEQMARLLGVSFASVNRWEGAHSAVTGATLDLYEALDASLKAGYTREHILQDAWHNRGLFLYRLFRMAYAKRDRTRKAI